ncbi:metal-binding protein, partial [Halobacteriales archaeon QH_6_68_27]
KTDHKNAVFALADGITSEMSETRERVPASAD